jgi:hypothetical protein
MVREYDVDADSFALSSAIGTLSLQELLPCSRAVTGRPQFTQARSVLGPYDGPV